MDIAQMGQQHLRKLYFLRLVMAASMGATDRDDGNGFSLLQKKTQAVEDVERLEDVGIEIGATQRGGIHAPLACRALETGAKPRAKRTTD